MNNNSLKVLGWTLWMAGVVLGPWLWAIPLALERWLGSDSIIRSAGWVNGIIVSFVLVCWWGTIYVGSAIVALPPDAKPDWRKIFWQIKANGWFGFGLIVTLVIAAPACGILSQESIRMNSPTVSGKR